jgi:hypothetical protein
MRKLTVKNFSVIKEAELEFGKITVLIGPQSSGKSLLCKVAFFFTQFVPEVIDRQFVRNISFEELIQQICSEFIDKFPEDSWSGQEFLLQYESENLGPLTVQRAHSTKSPMFNFAPKFEAAYNRWTTSGPSVGRLPIASRIRLVTEDPGYRLDPPLRSGASIYIPTGRSFYSTPNRGFVSLATKNLDWITQRYAPEFDATYKALLESYATEVPILSEFGKLATKILKGRVVHEAGRLVFESTEDERHRPFELLSSGTLELLPIINTLSQLVKGAQYPDIDIPGISAPPLGAVYVEEPELSVFPSTQNDLVRLFSWLAGEESLRMSYAITTHSPYILSAFGNLLKAGKVGAQSAEHHAAVEKTVPEKYWIKNSDFAAYKIENGVLKNIFDKETGQIDGDYLDDVSSDIAEEFGQLLEIQYGG